MSPAPAGPIRVGLVGASLQRGGWAIQAHAPTVAAMPGFALQAVATTRRETAEEAAQALSAPLAFTSAEELAREQSVDLVVVGVNVREHAPVVRAAIAAGKAVLCEWPLGVSTAEAEELGRLAAAAGVAAVVGLQARMAPAVRYAAELLADGYVGELHAATLVASSPLPGAIRLPEAYAWHADRRNSITVLRIPGAHALDPLCALAGELAELSAQVLTLAPEVQLEETGVRIPRDADDHVAIAGRTAAGAAVVAQLQGGSSAAIGTTLELRGPEGLLRIATSQPRQLQIAHLELSGTRDAGPPAPIAIPDRLTAHIPDVLRGTPGENVAGLYDALRSLLDAGEAPWAPDFPLAVRRHRLLDRIERSSPA
jgi:predicted dehydrogenase